MSIDWQMLWDMGGHGPYVWGSYGFAVALLAAEVLALWGRRRALRARQGNAPRAKAWS